MGEHRATKDEIAQVAKVERLREEIAKGDAAIVAGDVVEFANEQELAEFVARL